MSLLNWTKSLLRVPGTENRARHRISRMSGTGTLSVKVVRKRGVKNLTLRFEGPEQVKVTIPWHTSHRVVLNFLESKQDWLQEQQKLFEKWMPWLERKGIADEQYYYLGQRLTLRYGVTLLNQMVIQPDPQHPDGPTLWCHWPEKIKRQEQNLPLVKKALDRFFGLEARRIIEPKVFLIADKIQVPRPVKVQFRMQKSRWGSCSSRGTINLNRRLIGAPPQVIESVICHELCHLIHMNHSPEFWQLLQVHSPSYELCDRWLNEHQMMLY